MLNDGPLNRSGAVVLLLYEVKGGYRRVMSRNDDDYDSARTHSEQLVQVPEKPLLNRLQLLTSLLLIPVVFEVNGWAREVNWTNNRSSPIGHLVNEGDINQNSSGAFVCASLPGMWCNGWGRGNLFLNRIISWALLPPSVLAAVQGK